MQLVAYAVPFFLLSILVEVCVDLYRKTGYYRINDAVSSLSTGILSRTIGFFSKFVGIAIFGLVSDFASLPQLPEWLFEMPTPVGLAAWGLALVAYDFCYYWNHRIGHERAIFWASHVVHHQSEDYNLSTALRQTSSGFLLGWIFYLPLVAIGLPKDVFALVAAIDLVYQFWVHTKFIPKLGWFEYVFISPSNHRVHHAQNDRYLDKNYGGIFIIWDRLFGTYQEELDEEAVVYGVKKPSRSWNPFWVNLDVYAALFMDSIRAEHWRDKLYVWISRTGWRPADVAAKYPVKLAELTDFQKYDPGAPRNIKYYILFQFLVAAAGIPFLLRVAPQIELWKLPLICAPVWITLFTVGALSEGSQKPHGKTAEWVRLGLLVSAMAVVRVVFWDVVPPFAATGFVLYVAVSVMWFAWIRRAGPAAMPTKMRDSAV